LHHAEGKIDEAIAAATTATALFEEALDWFQAGSAAMYLVLLQAKTDPEAARQSGERAIHDFEKEGDANAAAAARTDLESLLKRHLSPWLWLVILAIGVVAGIVAIMLVAALIATLRGK
jgi:hypothetical protein